VKKYTYSATDKDKTNKWYIVDANGATLGRLATTIASRLRGKHNPLFTPHVDLGDSIIVINSDQIVLTGKKMDKKLYHHHSGYMGGLKSITARKLMEKCPEDLIRIAVRGMLPKNSLGRKMLKRLRVYVGETHPHQAQAPEVLTVNQ
jgi:large subunit ribosomal protein L13